MDGKSLDKQYFGRYSILAAIMLGSIMGAIDAGVVNVTLPTITQSFNIGISIAPSLDMAKN
ncbi:hypothetical protein ACFLV5_05025 [Chloroflexota bacterium]